MRRFFTVLASRSAYLMGHPAAFLIAALACLLWAVTGPLFGYSDTWQLVINTATTVLTFLAVFLIQNSQNRDGIAIQAKLDEIIIAVSRARTQLVGIENLTDAEVAELKAAIEREALQSEIETEEGARSVEDILNGRSEEDKKAKLQPGVRRKVAETAKRAIDAAAAEVAADGKGKPRNAAASKPKGKRGPSGRR